MGVPQITDLPNKNLPQKGFVFVGNHWEFRGPHPYIHMLSCWSCCTCQLPHFLRGSWGDFLIPLLVCKGSAHRWSHYETMVEVAAHSRTLGINFLKDLDLPSVMNMAIERCTFRRCMIELCIIYFLHDNSEIMKEEGRFNCSVVDWRVY